MWDKKSLTTGNSADEQNESNQSWTGLCSGSTWHPLKPYLCQWGTRKSFHSGASFAIEIGNLEMGEKLGVRERTWEFMSYSLRLTWRCFLSPFVTDGKDWHGLKLEKIGPIFFFQPGEIPGSRPLVTAPIARLTLRENVDRNHLVFEGGKKSTCSIVSQSEDATTLLYHAESSRSLNKMVDLRLKEQRTNA